MAKFLFFICCAILFNDCTEKNNNDVASSLNPNWYNVGFLISDGVYNTELTAPYDIFQHTKYRENIKAMNVFTVADKRGIVTTFEGLKITPDFVIGDNNIPKIDILVVPSAEHHLDSDLEKKEVLNWIAKISESALFVTSHCDGAFMLAKAGVLNGHASTTFPSDIPKYKEMFPELIVIDSVYFVHDEKFITSSGGAKSFEAALYLSELLYGDTIAKSLAKGLVIDWDLNKTPHTIR